MLIREGAGSMQAESSKLKAKRGNIPDLYFQLRLQRTAHLIHEIVQ
jgi:hypothetical protein